MVSNSTETFLTLIYAYAMLMNNEVLFTVFEQSRRICHGCHSGPSAGLTLLHHPGSDGH